MSTERFVMKPGKWYGVTMSGQVVSVPMFCERVEDDVPWLSFKVETHLGEVHEGTVDYPRDSIGAYGGLDWAEIPAPGGAEV